MERRRVRKMDFISLGLVLLFVINITDCFSQEINSLDERHIDYLDPENIPPQPPIESRYFIEDMKAPMWNSQSWNENNVQSDEADISQGVEIVSNFNSNDGHLEMAYKDLKDFLTAGEVDIRERGYPIITRYYLGLENEAFKIKVFKDSCLILASDEDGIRRGIFYLEDEMRKLRRPALKVGDSEHSPVIKRRIIRGYFSPTKRPGSIVREGHAPVAIDELMNDIDYYPDGYLNKLAHQGINGLWLSLSGTNEKGEYVGFGDLVSTSVTPYDGVNGRQRLSKLKKIVEKCSKYGIKVYLFTIEPSIRISANDPILNRYKEEEILGDQEIRNLCVSTEAGQQYLYESTKKIFGEIPELGGLINISHGERYTTCLSSLSATGAGEIRCPRCSKLPPWQILYNSLSAMEKGMHESSSTAELISWLYMPQPQSQSIQSIDTLADWVYEIPAHTPEGVVLQFNFTSGVKKDVFDKKLVGGDYWLMPAGPSERFNRVANVARECQTPISAKIQTGTSHEITTVPYVPVPSVLYKKFASMRDLGVTHSMLSWYFGNAPGLMIKAVDLLAFDSLSSESQFLNDLASVFWKEKDIFNIVKAWKFFEKGYSYYPLTNLFQYYGPMHDGPVWPLLLYPQDLPLSPTWLLGSTQTTSLWPPSGDRIGESFTNLLTLGEVVNLCEEMSASWDSGVAILNKLIPDYSNEPDRLLDIGVAKAIGIQFRSGYNILRFYEKREKLFRTEGETRLQLLNELRDIISEEIGLDKELLLLSRQDSRLGFHPEAEGYKYYPNRILWRMEQLRHILHNELPEIRLRIEENKPLFPEYIGVTSDGLVSRSEFLKNDVGGKRPKVSSVYSKLDWQTLTHGANKNRLLWAAFHSENSLYLIIRGNSEQRRISPLISRVVVRIQPKRLWASQRFDFDLNDKEVKWIDSEEELMQIEIPWKYLGAERDFNRMRMDIQIISEDNNFAEWCMLTSYTNRLMYGSDNPNDYGWLELGN